MDPSAQPNAAAAAKTAINLDYLAPTLSAIVAGIIHHAYREKKELSWGEVLLIASPSMPILCQLVLKCLTWALSFVVELGKWDVSWFKGWFSTATDEQLLDKNAGLVEDGQIPVYWNFTPDKTPAQKMVEWQKEGYCIGLFNTMNICVDDFIQTFSHVACRNTCAQDATKLVWYHEFDVGQMHVCMYINKNTTYMAGKSIDPNVPLVIKSFDLWHIVYKALFPVIYKENTSRFRISRIHNQYAEEIMETVKKYKAGKLVNLNFLFAGPPGTCKTYAARAIAAEMNRTLVEIDLKSIVTEDEFLEHFNDKTHKCVFLLDELDLMCPSREMDDLLLKSMEQERKQKMGLTLLTNGSTSSESDSDISDQQQFGLLQQINQKLDTILGFQDWVKYALVVIVRLLFLLCGMQGTVAQEHIIKLDERLKLEKGSSYSIKVTKVFGLYEKMDPTGVELVYPEGTGNNNPIEANSKPKLKPFTLRTLLSFISGGSTPTDLCIVATTNRPHLIDEALLRPGRLRLIEFHNLRKVDALAMIKEEYPEMTEEVLTQVGYTDFQCSGALVSAILASTVSLTKFMEVFERELKKMSAVCSS